MRRNFEAGADPVLHIGIFPLALHFDAVETQLGGALGRAGGIRDTHPPDPVVNQYLVLQLATENAAQRPVDCFADQVEEGDVPATAAQGAWLKGVGVFADQVGRLLCVVAVVRSAHAEAG